MAEAAAVEIVAVVTVEIVVVVMVEIVVVVMMKYLSYYFLFMYRKQLDASKIKVLYVVDSQQFTEVEIFIRLAIKQ